MRISDWSSDVCSSDLRALASQMASARLERTTIELADDNGKAGLRATGQVVIFPGFLTLYQESFDDPEDEDSKRLPKMAQGDRPDRSEEHTSELQSLMRISYAVFCLKKKTTTNQKKIVTK